MEYKFPHTISDYKARQRKTLKLHILLHIIEKEAGLALLILKPTQSLYRNYHLTAC